MTRPLPQIRVRSERTSPEEVFTLWRESITPYFHTTPTGKFDAQGKEPWFFSLIHAGDFILGDARLPSQKFTRSVKWGRRHDDADHILLQTFTKGCNSVSCGGRDYLLDQGVYAVNLGYETIGDSSEADLLTLVLPRHWVSMHLPKLAVARGRLFASGSEAERLFHSHMLFLRDALPRATQSDVSLYSGGLLALLGALLDAGDPTAKEARVPVLGSVQAYVEAHLGKRSLSAEMIMRHFAMAPATLFRLFEDLGGVGSYIQRRRLLACFRALSDPKLIHRRIPDVARGFGLSASEPLDALFREHFGMSPEEVREEARSRSGSVVTIMPSGAQWSDDIVETMHAWATTLGGPPSPRSGSFGALAE